MTSAVRPDDGRTQLHVALPMLRRRVSKHANATDVALTSLSANYYHLARRDCAQRMKNARQKRSELLHAIPEPDDRNNADTDAFDILLKFDAHVVRDEHFEVGVERGAEKHTVTQTEPTLCTHRRSVVPDEFHRELAWKALINEHSHCRSSLLLQVPTPQQLAPS